MANTHIRFKESESEYSASNSDDDYTEKERNLLHNIRNRKTEDSDSDNEVYGIGSEDEESSEHGNGIALSDVEGQDDGDDLPDIRAWGKDKRKFYSTDYVDPDYSGFQGKNATLAELEEEEAKNLQKQLIQELDDEDFSLEIFIKHKEPENRDELEEVVKTDVSKLSKRQKLQLVKQESPEFFELINDFKVKITIAKEVLKPTLELINKNKMECEAAEFVKFYYQLILNYTTNISMYLLLKASKVNLKNHPIVKRLFQYRQHLSQMDGVFEEVIKPQIEILISLSEQNTLHEPKKKMLKLLSIIQNKKEYNTTPVKESSFATNEIKTNSNGSKETHKQMKFAVNKLESDTDSSDSEDLQNAESEKIDEDNADDQIIGEKRAITYQIAKNKGLTPHRKKEQRNPRVKHRNKFRKAKIRRKGAIRDVRKELSRYSGEISGIKTFVTKSIKIKG